VQTERWNLLDHPNEHFAGNLAEERLFHSLCSMILRLVVTDERQLAEDVTWRDQLQDCGRQGG
jgi:hypothetical protein